MFSETLRWAASTITVENFTVKGLKEIKDAGIDLIEISGGGLDRLIRELNFIENPYYTKALCDEAGVEIFSLHLPFGKRFDLINDVPEEIAYILKTLELLIRSAAKIGIKMCVLHPSTDGIADEERPEKRKLSLDGIVKLQAVAQEVGIVLAVENLPRTCLCYCSDEMIDMLSGTGVKIIFDMNHAPVETDVEFIDKLSAAGFEIYSIHISDYYGAEEKHNMPGDGTNKWRDIFDALERAGYKGPLMYEVSCYDRRDGKFYTAKDVAENMAKLSRGLIS